MQPYFRYSDLIENFKDREVFYILEPPPFVNLKINGKAAPGSITEDEFNFLKNKIIEMNLTSGYELATGLGISGLAAALGFLETKGSLITVDAYVEEFLNDGMAYLSYEYFDENKDPAGLKSCKQLIEFYHLEEHITPYVGWSPTNIPKILDDANVDSFDYIFIDGGHEQSRLELDFDVVYPYLDRNKPFLVAIHDSHLFDLDRIRESLGVKEYIPAMNTFNIAIFESPRPDNVNALSEYIYVPWDANRYKGKI